MFSIVKLIFLVLTVSAFAVQAEDDIYQNCGDSFECAEDRLIKVVDEIDAKESIEILDDSISLTKTRDVMQARHNEDLFDRLTRFMSSREVNIKIPDSDARNFEEARRRKKLRRFILPLLLVLKLKAAIIIPAILSLIALVSFKGLGASLMALTIAGATGLKSLLDSHGPKVSYEVVPQIHAPLWSRTGIENYPAGQGYHTIP